jgi:hypothetical protein
MRRSRAYRDLQAGTGWGLVLGALLLCAGCETPGGPQVGPQARDDIVAIQQYPPTDPWLRDEEGRVNGMRTRVYFLPAAGEQQVPKGIFVPGTIHAALYVLFPRPDGSYERQLAHEWDFNERGAEGFRIRRPSVMGQSYGLILRWPMELDLAGREIQITLSYQRSDGEAIARRGTRFRVPLPVGASVPRSAASTPARGVPDTERGERGPRRPTGPGSP